MSEQRRLPGRRVVTAMYLAILALTGVFGYAIGRISPGQIDPVLFFVIPLPETPLGVAIYGVVTVGTILGILLVLVEYVSERTGAGRR